MAQVNDHFGSKPGARSYRTLPVTVELGGYEISLPVHYVCGNGEGPTLTLLSTLHGGEWMSIEVLRRILTEVNPMRLRGSILAVTVGNPVGLTHLVRNVPDGLDFPDVNRCFGSAVTTVAGLMARKITQEVLPRTDYLIDFHQVEWGAAVGIIIYGNTAPDPKTNERTDALARSFGFPMLRPGESTPGTVSAQAGVMGIPAIAAEIGGPGWGPEAEETWLNQNVTGVFNVLRGLSMIDGDPILPEQYFYSGKRWRLGPSFGGYLHSNTGPERLLTRVEKGEELGRVLSMASLEVLERIEAPAASLLTCIARSYPVRPGGWAYGLAELDSLRIVRRS